MATDFSREYNCKDEELPVICKFTAFSLRRDLPEFTAYSPKFNEQYLSGFESSNAKATDVIDPKSETMERKASTAKLYLELDKLVDPINRLRGYLGISDAGLAVNAADFGLTDLRRSITSRDAEKAIRSLHLVNANIAKYKDQLMARGLTEELIGQFVTAADTIAKVKQNQYEILIKRKSIVQSNMALLNSLHGQLTEILTVGKILYKATNPAKLQEYTFSDLKKRVRLVSKPASEPTDTGKK